MTETSMEAAERPGSVWSLPVFWKLFVPSVGVGLEQQILNLALPLLVFQALSSEIEMNIVRAIGFVPTCCLPS